MHLFGKGFSRPYGVPPPSSSETTGSRSSSSSSSNNNNTGIVEEEEEKVGFENSNHNHGDNSNHHNNNSDTVTSIDFSSDDGGQRVVSKDGMDKDQGLGLGLEQDNASVMGDGMGSSGTNGVGVLVPTLTTHVSSTHSTSTTRGGDRVVIPKSEVSSTTSFAKACSLPGIFRNVFSSSNHSAGNTQPTHPLHAIVTITYAINSPYHHHLLHYHNFLSHDISYHQPSSSSIAHSLSISHHYTNNHLDQYHSLLTITGGYEEPPEVPDKEVHVMVSGAEPG